MDLVPSNIKFSFLKGINICELPWLNQKGNTGASRVFHRHEESKLIWQFAYLKSLRAFSPQIIVPIADK